MLALWDWVGVGSDAHFCNPHVTELDGNQHLEKMTT